MLRILPSDMTLNIFPHHCHDQIRARDNKIMLSTSHRPNWWIASKILSAFDICLSAYIHTVRLEKHRTNNEAMYTV